MRHFSDLPSVLLQKCLILLPERIVFFRHNGKGCWVKRPERLGSLRRLQKGDAEESFRREVALLKQFRDRGAPVVPIAAEAPDRIILPDMGLTLAVLGQRVPDCEFRTLLQEAAVALSQVWPMAAHACVTSAGPVASGAFCLSERSRHWASCARRSGCL